MLHFVAIGVNEYRDMEIGDLHFATRDATEMALLFERRVRAPERQVHLLVDGEATKARLCRLLCEELPGVVKSNDVVVLYVACHGVKEIHNRMAPPSSYLAVHDTAHARVFSTGIELDSELVSWTARLGRARLVVTFIDSCFSGKSGGRSFAGPEYLRWSIRAPSKVSLRNLSLGRGQVLLAAADDHQIAREDRQSRHGVFTLHLLEALKRPRGGTESVLLAALYAEVYDAVARATGGEQTPVLRGQNAGAALPVLVENAAVDRRGKEEP